jgi:hypothetical protein
MNIRSAALQSPAERGCVVLDQPQRTRMAAMRFPDTLILPGCCGWSGRHSRAPFASVRISFAAPRRKQEGVRLGLRLRLRAKRRRTYLAAAAPIWSPILSQANNSTSNFTRAGVHRGRLTIKAATQNKQAA